MNNLKWPKSHVFQGPPPESKIKYDFDKIHKLIWPKSSIANRDNISKSRLVNFTEQILYEDSLKQSLMSIWAKVRGTSHVGNKNKPSWEPESSKLQFLIKNPCGDDSKYQDKNVGGIIQTASPMEEPCQDYYETLATQTVSEFETPYRGSYLVNASSPVPHKYIMDAVYGMISLDSRIFQIIDTPHFQRLRYIKQLGTSYMCFPTATHTRFCHSVGTCYLAGEFFDRLAINDRTLDLRPVDRLLVQVAGLLHDLGHGPFSHSFEHSILPKLLGDHQWNHEAQGLRLIDHLFDNEEVTLFDTSETKRLKQILKGDISSEYRWMHQMISNSDYGVDMDRLDYLQRDSNSVGLHTGFNFSVLSSHVKVLDGGIGFHEKREPELIQFFQTRYNLYNQIYNHSTTKSIEYMLVDAIVDSEPVLKIREALEDHEKFLKLNDSIFNIMDMNGGPVAKRIINDITRRRFYPKIYNSDRPPPSELLQDRDNILDVISNNYGCGADNPLEKVPYYGKEDKKYNKLILPSKFEQIKYRVYSKRT